MTQNFDRWLAERLEEELPDPMAIPSDPATARYRAPRAVPRGLPRFARTLVPSVAAQLVLAGAGVAVAVAAGAAATGHTPTSFIPAVGGASSATAPPQGSVDGAGATTAGQGAGQSSQARKSSQSAPAQKKAAVPGPAATWAARGDDGRPGDHASPGPRPSESPEPPHSGDHAAQPAPSPSPVPGPPHTDH